MKAIWRIKVEGILFEVGLCLVLLVGHGRVKVYSKSSLHRNSDDVALVAPKANWDQVEWIEKFCETFKCTPNIYTMDANPEDGYLIPRTIQGHEAAAYLTYIVDNYDSLAPFTLFVHGGEDHWHNDMAGPKTYHALYSLRLEAVKAYGYANLRCLWTPGCPDTLHPSIIQKSDEAYEYLVDMFPEIYSELFGVNETEVPQKFAHQCCAQFAVTRERIRERPLSDYERILNWVENTHVTDSYGIGWTVEKIWHILFGMPASYCPQVENPLTLGESLQPVSWSEEGIQR
ncbi:hypothetical protein BDV25DRAFT_169871 [Aspergillus avenaceus]|uniref:Uncharacterized protein n=1 Tax=Aspergillus avenaceus TaxID=36643 RepID=A0A5N6U2U0_ASPAV|nr:hypothetical protein BDV25DRAFT_169871 [Aspergillus avenaceus]